MVIKNVYNLTKDTYKYISKEQKIEMFAEKRNCTVCGELLYSVEEYEKFLNTKFLGKKNLFSPIFFEDNMYVREVCENCVEDKYPNNKYNVTPHTRNTVCFGNFGRICYKWIERIEKSH